MKIECIALLSPLPSLQRSPYFIGYEFLGSDSRTISMPTPTVRREIVEGKEGARINVSARKGSGVCVYVYICTIVDIPSSELDTPGKLNVSVVELN